MEYDDIGISRQLDWARVKKLLSIGLLAAMLHLIGDVILGWGTEDESLMGLARMLSAYTGTSDGGIFAASLLGLLGVTLEGLSYFGVYCLMAERSPECAHSYRAGIFGYVIFCGCGFHVPVCALTFLAKHGLEEALLRRCAAYFVMPALALFGIFFLVLTVSQLKAFAKGFTPYPRWCWVFSLPVGMLAAMALGQLGNSPVCNALSCAWIAIGNLWMFGGLLASMKRCAKK